jgi:hypothetical protein
LDAGTWLEDWLPMADTDLMALVRIADAAHVLQVTPDRVRQLIRNGSLPSISTPLGKLLNTVDVERLAAARKGATAITA